MSVGVDSAGVIRDTSGALPRRESYPSVASCSAARSRRRALAAHCRASDAAIEPACACGASAPSHVLQLPTDSPAFGPPLDHKAPVSAPSAVVDESEKRKRTRSPCVARSSVLGHEFPELDEARLVPVECQLELPQPLPERHQHLPCVRLALKAHHEVVRVAHETDSPVPRLLPPLLDPQVERVMQKDVRQERTDPRPLWRPLYRLP